jgi:hypothetical protein
VSQQPNGLVDAGAGSASECGTCHYVQLALAPVSSSYQNDCNLSLQFNERQVKLLTGRIAPSTITSIICHRLHALMLSPPILRSHKHMLLFYRFFLRLECVDLLLVYARATCETFILPKPVANFTQFPSHCLNCSLFIKAAAAKLQLQQQPRGREQQELPVVESFSRSWAARRI